MAKITSIRASLATLVGINETIFQCCVFMIGHHTSGGELDSSKGNLETNYFSIDI